MDSVSLLDPNFETVKFDAFRTLAESYDALIAEFYEYYEEKGHDHPSLFGFVTVDHRVKFSDTDEVFTRNIVGQKTTIIFAPIIEGETKEEQQERRLRLLAYFDHTKRASHILALSLLIGLLRSNAVNKLIEKHQVGEGDEGVKEHP